MTAASTVYLPGLLTLGIVSGIVTVCVNLMLMWGVIRRRRSLMMPWIVIGKNPLSIKFCNMNMVATLPACTAFGVFAVQIVHIYVLHEHERT